MSAADMKKTGTIDGGEGAYDNEQFIHVLPCFGRRHDASIVCWCQPEPDEEVPEVWIHHSTH